MAVQIIENLKYNESQWGGLQWYKLPREKNMLSSLLVRSFHHLSLSTSGNSQQHYLTEKSRAKGHKL